MIHFSLINLQISPFGVSVINTVSYSDGALCNVHNFGALIKHGLMWSYMVLILLLD